MNEVGKLYFLSKFGNSEEKCINAKCTIVGLAEKYPINIVELCKYLSEITHRLWGFKSYIKNTKNGEEFGVSIGAVLSDKKYHFPLPEEQIADGKFTKINWSTCLHQDDKCPLLFKKAIIHGMGKKIKEEKKSKNISKNVEINKN